MTQAVLTIFNSDTFVHRVVTTPWEPEEIARRMYDIVQPPFVVHLVSSPAVPDLDVFDADGLVEAVGEAFDTLTGAIIQVGSDTLHLFFHTTVPNTATFVASVVEDYDNPRSRLIAGTDPATVITQAFDAVGARYMEFRGHTHTYYLPRDLDGLARRNPWRMAGSEIFAAGSLERWPPSAFIVFRWLIGSPTPASPDAPAERR